MIQDHIGLNIYQALTDILEYWNLRLDKLTCVTTDNGSNFIAAFSDQDVLRLSCYGQCLDLAICKGLQIHRVEMVVMKCWALVETISRSWKQSHDF